MSPGVAPAGERGAGWLAAKWTSTHPDEKYEVDDQAPQVLHSDRNRGGSGGGGGGGGSSGSSTKTSSSAAASTSTTRIDPPASKCTTKRPRPFVRGLLRRCARMRASGCNATQSGGSLTARSPK